MRYNRVGDRVRGLVVNPVWDRLVDRTRVWSLCWSHVDARVRVRVQNGVRSETFEKINR